MNIGARLGKVRTEVIEQEGRKPEKKQHPPACKYRPCPGARRYDEPHRRCYIGYYPESQVGDKHQVQLSGMMMGGFDAGVS